MISIRATNTAGLGPKGNDPGLEEAIEGLMEHVSKHPRVIQIVNHLSGVAGYDNAKYGCHCAIEIKINGPSGARHYMSFGAKTGKPFYWKYAAAFSHTSDGIVLEDAPNHLSLVVPTK